MLCFFLIKLYREILNGLWYYIFYFSKINTPKQIYSAHKTYWQKKEKIFLHKFVFSSSQDSRTEKTHILTCHRKHFKCFGQNVMYTHIVCQIHVHIHTHKNKSMTTNYMTLEKVLNLLPKKFLTFTKINLYHIYISLKKHLF